ncbi:cyclic nucleotide-binding/CBS domain-containing protein [Nanoarchaeota archaeon]
METGYKVCDAMTRKPIILSSDTSIRNCAQEMEKNHIGTVLVGHNNVLEGVLSEKDIVRNVVSKGLNPDQTSVDDVMEKNLITIDPAADIYEALVKMKEFNIKHLPVMDGPKMVGLLTIKDILKIEPHLFDMVAEKFELREEETKPVKNVFSYRMHEA